MTAQTQFGFNPLQIGSSVLIGERSRESPLLRRGFNPLQIGSSVLMSDDFYREVAVEKVSIPYKSGPVF